MMPILASSGVIMPGQLGPRRIEDESFRRALTLIMSATGIPSVMQTTSPISASIAAIMASAANFGGTKIILTSNSRLSLASLTELNTGTPKCSCPPLPGVTPPTILEP